MKACFNNVCWTHILVAKNNIYSVASTLTRSSKNWNKPAHVFLPSLNSWHHNTLSVFEFRIWVCTCIWICICISHIIFLPSLDSWHHNTLSVFEFWIWVCTCIWICICISHIVFLPSLDSWHHNTLSVATAGQALPVSLRDEQWKACNTNAKQIQLRVK